MDGVPNGKWEMENGERKICATGGERMQLFSLCNLHVMEYSIEINNFQAINPTSSQGFLPCQLLHSVSHSIQFISKTLITLLKYFDFVFSLQTPCTGAS